MQWTINVYTVWNVEFFLCVCVLNMGINWVTLFILRLTKGNTTLCGLYRHLFSIGLIHKRLSAPNFNRIDFFLTLWKGIENDELSINQEQKKAIVLKSLTRVWNDRFMLLNGNFSYLAIENDVHCSYCYQHRHHHHHYENFVFLLYFHIEASINETIRFCWSGKYIHNWCVELASTTMLPPSYHFLFKINYMPLHFIPPDYIWTEKEVHPAFKFEKYLIRFWLKGIYSLSCSTWTKKTIRNRQQNTVVPIEHLAMKQTNVHTRLEAFNSGRGTKEIVKNLYNEIKSIKDEREEIPPVYQFKAYPH